MGELVAGRPALQLNTATSLPLDLVSVMSLLYRAVPGSGLERWLVNVRRSLPESLRLDLDVLHGFSGRLLYYMEEPIMRFEPLRVDRIDAQIEDVIAFLETLPAVEYRQMVEHSIERVHRDLGNETVTAPSVADVEGWRAFAEPALTTATADDVVALVSQPELLKERTVGLLKGLWDHVYAADYAEHREELEQAAEVAVAATRQGFGAAFSELTGNRMPSTMISGLNDVECVTFCPSYHLGSFVSYIIYPPDLVVFFGAPELLDRQTPVRSRVTPENRTNDHIAPRIDAVSPLVSTDDMLEGIRALGDVNRLRVIELLSGGELYAQEIVGRLGIAQSAVSRHLSLLERAGLVRVQPRGGKRYYAVDCARMHALADAIRCRGGD